MKTKKEAISILHAPEYLAIILVTILLVACNPDFHTTLFNRTTITTPVPDKFTDGPVIEDLFSENISNFSMFLAYKNRIYIGPNSSENTFLRLNADGTNQEEASLVFHGESGTTTTLDPGPDSEDGIDFFISGFIDGTEYLFIGPSKSGGQLNYLYYTTDSGTDLDFDYIDINSVLGPQSKGISSMHTFNNNLYVSSPDTGAWKPRFSKISSIVSNPVDGTDVFNLEAGDMPGLGSENNEAYILGIDTIADFNSRLYIADGGSNASGVDGAIYRSKNNDPGDYFNFPDHWLNITPAGNPEWNKGGTRFSNELPGTNKLTPAMKAFPAMVVFNDLLYVIRNTNGTAGGPQLWKYDRTDWELVAANGTGISNMSNSNNSHVTLLVVNGERLYIGYNNSSDGLQIWRTKSCITDPATEIDFESVSTDGFGDAVNNKEIYHSLSMYVNSTDYLWVLCGSESGSLRVYRTMN